jgi:AcrR family transcriptional regulator
MSFWQNTAMNVQAVTLRGRQAMATRDEIIDAAMNLLTQHTEEPFSHETIAKWARMGARTVYRYFPSRADLMQALWQRVRDDTHTRFPESERELVPIVRRQFREFDRHEALVRATLASSASRELHDQGSLEGRPAFRRCLKEIFEALPAFEQRRLIAVCLAIYSAPFWRLLRDRGELNGAEASEAGAWAMEAVLKAARSNVAKMPGINERRTKKS